MHHEKQPDVVKECKRVGQRIRRERTSRLLTLSDVADEMDAYKSNLSQIENGVTIPTIPTLIRLANAIGCNPVDFWVD